MKNALKIFMSLMAVGLILFNFSVNKNELFQTNISLENIKAMQVSAGEQYCDNQAYKECNIKVWVGGTWVTGYSTGNLREN